MVELRWITPEGTTTKPPRLQWRSRAMDPWARWTLWTEWQDVPTVVTPAALAPVAVPTTPALASQGQHDAPPPIAWCSDAVRDVAAERRRQIELEGWTPEHDDEHTHGELAQAAACYALNVQRIPIRCGDSTLWPKGWGASWFRPKDRRRDLVRAAALLLAEIERLDRIQR